MRWERMLADLEAQLEAEERADERARTADLLRAELAGIVLADRLRAGAGGGELVVTLADGERVTGTVLEAADQWLLLASGGREVLVPTTAVAAVAGLPIRASGSTGVAARLGLGHVLRGIARDRGAVIVRTAAGSWTGRVERVGRDHLDLATGPSLREARLAVIPFAAVLSVTAVSGG